MLVLCYGMPRSGSTLAYHLVRTILADGGWPQHPLSVPGVMRKNFIPKVHGRRGVDREVISRILEAIGPKNVLAAKTHEPVQPRLGPWLEDLQGRGELQVIASYRDPRDLCLSLLDAGADARRRGIRPFSRIGTLADAAESVEKRIEQFRLWAAIKGTLCLYYDTVAFAPEAAINAIATVLRITCDPTEVKRRAFDAAQRHLNRGIADRYRSELSVHDAKMLTSRFREFIESACQRSDDVWLTQTCRR